jgi:hypothetical protein
MIEDPRGLYLSSNQGSFSRFRNERSSWFLSLWTKHPSPLSPAKDPRGKFLVGPRDFNESDFISPGKGSLYLPEMSQSSISRDLHIVLKSKTRQITVIIHVNCNVPQNGKKIQRRQE